MVDEGKQILNEEDEDLFSSIAEDDDRHSTYSLESNVFPDIDYDPSFYEEPYENENFWDDLQNLQHIDNSAAQISGLLELVKPNFIIGNIEPDLKKRLQVQLEPIFSALTAEHLKSLPTSALGRLFHLRNVLGFNQPGDDIFFTAGTLDPDKERWVVERTDRYIKALLQDKELMQALFQNRDTLPAREIFKQWKSMLNHAAVSFDVDLNSFVPELIRSDDTDPNELGSHVATTSRTMPAYVTVTTPSLRRKVVDLIQTTAHEMVHVRHAVVSAKFASNEIDPLFPRNSFLYLISLIAHSIYTEASQLMGNTGPSWRQPGDLSPHDLYAANMTGLYPQNILLGDGSGISTYDIQSEKYAYVASIAAAIFIEQSDEFNPKSKGTLRELNAYQSGGDLRLRIAKHYEEKIGCKFIDMIRRNYFVKTKNDEPEIPAETAVAALWKFKEIQKDDLSCKTAQIAIGSLYPELTSRYTNFQDPMLAPIEN